MKSTAFQFLPPSLLIPQLSNNNNNAKLFELTNNRDVHFSAQALIPAEIVDLDKLGLRSSACEFASSSAAESLCNFSELSLFLFNLKRAVVRI